MDFMTAPVQLTRQRTLGRTVSAVVQMNHKYAQPVGAPYYLA
jgi:hypothetical protein